MPHTLLHRRILWVFLFALLELQVGAQPLLPASSRLDLDVLRKLVRQHPDPQDQLKASRGRYPLLRLNGRNTVGFLGMVEEGSELPSHAHVAWGARIGNIVSFRVEADHLEAVNTLAGIRYAELATTYHRMLHDVVRDVRADSVQQGINLPQTYTGRNTILGIVDIGFDYGHPMFYDTALTATRVIAAWDQRKQSGPAPAGYAYGTVHEGEAALLAAETDTADAFGVRHLHGTHVAGIAGGAGAGTPYRGIAFDAEFLFVSFGQDAASVFDAFAWMHDRAMLEGKRLVINASWGSRDGPLDGSSLLNQAMDLLTDQGVLFVCANGNYGDVPCHLKREFAGDTLRTRAAFSPNSSAADYLGQSLLLWGEPGEAFTASIAHTNTANTVLGASPWISTASGPGTLDSVLVNGNDSLYFNVAFEAAHPLNGRPYMRFMARRNSTLVKLALRVTAASGTVHAWNDELFTDSAALGGTAFQAAQLGWAAGDQLSTVIEPACGLGVIGVGAYRAEHEASPGVWSGGFLAGFSSRGPTMDERTKPDITAPGIEVISSINSYTTLSFTEETSVNFNGHDYPFGELSGTSMSTPVVTGCAALLFEAAPLAAPSAIKSVLLENARMDAFTGAIPPQGSTAWGMGKVNAYRAALALLGVAGMDVNTASDARAGPNPTNSIMHVQVSDGDPIERYTVVDATGRMVMEGTPNAPLIELDVSDLRPGAYSLFMNAGGRRFATRLMRP